MVAFEGFVLDSRNCQHKEALLCSVSRVGDYSQLHTIRLSSPLLLSPQVHTSPFISLLYSKTILYSKFVCSLTSNIQITQPNQQYRNNKGNTEKYPHSLSSQVWGGQTSLQAECIGIDDYQSHLKPRTRSFVCSGRLVDFPVSLQQMYIEISSHSRLNTQMLNIYTIYSHIVRAVTVDQLRTDVKRIISFTEISTST
jgi:hypothetical protein